MMDETGSGTGQPDDPGVDVPAVPSGEDVPSHAKDAPRISDEDQEQEQTTHPAPDDDVGVPPKEQLDDQ